MLPSATFAKSRRGFVVSKYRLLFTLCLPIIPRSKNICGLTPNELSASSRLRSSEYSVPILGLISLRDVDQKFSEGAGTRGRVARGERVEQRESILYPAPVH